MEDEFQSAANALRDDAKEYITYFVPEDEDRFEPLTMVLGFASALLVSFLAGFQEEAKRSAKKAGKSTFKWFVSLLTDFKEGKESETSKEAKRRANEAKQTKRSLKKQQVPKALDRAEQGLRDELAGRLGEAKATELAKKVRQVAERKILNGQ